jgi:hypothetical protein
VNSPKEDPSILDFSLSTLTIIDYGVIVPADCLARTLTSLKAGAGQFFRPIR